MERLMADAAEAGSKRVELMVQAGSVPAMTLYRSLGFAEKGLVRGYYRASGQDGIAMLAELA
jgi:ribosomal protein S18 acetylase RimI-like enzyme